MKQAVSVEHVSKVYPLGDSPGKRLIGHLFPSRRHHTDEFWALRDVSFSIRKGEAFAVIGQNGSGKSTLLQIVASILQPTTGSIKVDGRLSALLELGSGFNPEFTGRENVYMNASILGLTRARIDSGFAEIESFAEIGDFINQPVKTYSTGMMLRLAFAVAVQVEPEILIVDEALAVGDIAFRHRCVHRIQELRSRGLTLMFVSHDAGEVQALCDRALWLDGGVPQAIGPADEVVARYLQAVVQKNKAEIRESSPAIPHLPRRPQQAPEVVRSKSEGLRYGDMRAQVLGAAAVDAAGEPVNQLTAGSPVVFRISVGINQELPLPIVGFILRDPKGVIIFGTNTARENYPLPSMMPGEVHTVDFHWTPLEFAAKSYTVSVAVSSGTIDKFEVCDYIEDAITLQVLPSNPPVQGYLRIPCKSVTVHRFHSEPEVVSE